MNELRMYVEHLFVGRMLTEENIELKEEIYGNLVARYEDYINSGMDVDEALKLTKESITSIDEFIDEVANEATKLAESNTFDQDEVKAQSANTSDAYDPVDAGATTQNTAAQNAAAFGAVGSAEQSYSGAASDTSDTYAAAAAAATDATAAAAANQADATQVLVDDPASQSAFVPGGANVNTTYGQPTKKKLGKPAIIGIVAGAVLIVVLCCVFAFGFGGVGHNRNVANSGANSSNSSTQSDSSDTGTNNSSGSGDTSGSSGSSDTSGSSNSSNSSGTSNTGSSSSGHIWADPEDALEYEATMALVNEIESHSISSIQSYSNVSVSDTSSLEALTRALPMSSYVNSVSADTNSSNLTVAYTNVDGNIDGDAIDYALVYDAVATLSACPGLSSVTYTVQELYDDPHDIDAYVYSRTMLNSMLTAYGLSEISTEMIASDTSWQSVRDVISAHKFVDNASDYAERG